MLKRKPRFTRTRNAGDDKGGQRDLPIAGDRGTLSGRDEVEGKQSELKGRQSELKDEEEGGKEARDVDGRELPGPLSPEELERELVDACRWVAWMGVQVSALKGARKVR